MLPLSERVMSDNSDGRTRAKPPEYDPPNTSKLKSYANAAKSRGKIQMTQILNEYMRIKRYANDHQRNLIEISFIRINNKDTETPEFPSLETVGSYIFDMLKINPTDALEIDYFSNRERSKFCSEMDLI